MPATVGAPPQARIVMPGRVPSTLRPFYAAGEPLSVAQVCRKRYRRMLSLYLLIERANTLKPLECIQGGCPEVC